MQPEEFADLVVGTVKTALAPVLERLAVAEARLAMLPSTEKMLAEVRDRVLVVETKSALPVHITEAAPVDLAPVLERLTTVEARQADLKDRVLVVETKAANPQQDPTVSELRDRMLALETRTPTKELWDELSTARLQSLEWQAKKDDSISKELSALRERVAVVEVRPAVPGPAGEPGPAGKDGIDGKDGTAGLSFEGVYQDGKSYDFGQLVTFAGSSWHCNEPTTLKPGDGSKAWTLMVKRGRDGKDGRDAGANGLPVVRTQ